MSRNLCTIRCEQAVSIDVLTSEAGVELSGGRRYPGDEGFCITLSPASARMFAAVLIEAAGQAEKIRTPEQEPGA